MSDSASLCTVPVSDSEGLEPLLSSAWLAWPTWTADAQQGRRNAAASAPRQEGPAQPAEPQPQQLRSPQKTRRSQRARRTPAQRRPLDAGHEGVAGIADAVGEQARANTVIAKFDAEIEHQAYRDAGPRPLFVSYEADGWMTGSDSLVADVARTAGFAPLGARRGVWGGRRG